MTKEGITNSLNAISVHFGLLNHIKVSKNTVGDLSLRIQPTYHLRIFCWVFGFGVAKVLIDDRCSFGTMELEDK